MVFANRSAVRLILAAAVMSASGPALADMTFHVTEVVSEDEISPRHAHHTVRWVGDFYVSDTGVTVLGFGHKGESSPRPFDTPRHGVTDSGSAYTSTVRRVPDGIEQTIDYDSFVLTRRIVRTGPSTCSDTIAAVLKPGRSVYEVRRISNHEPMLETRREYVFVRCDVPALVG